MSERLPESLNLALRIIANDEHISISLIDIRKLMLTNLISDKLGAGWAVDQLDGDAELHKNDPSMNEVLKSGDPIKIVKMLVGF